MPATAAVDSCEDDVVVRVGDIRDLFIAPQADPLPIRTSTTVHEFLRSLQIEIRPQYPAASAV